MGADQSSGTDPAGVSASSSGSAPTSRRPGGDSGAGDRSWVAGPIAIDGTGLGVSTGDITWEDETGTTAVIGRTYEVAGAPVGSGAGSGATGRGRG